MTQSAGLNTCAHTGVAWHEIYIISSRFSRTITSSLYAARTMALFQAQTLLSEQTSSRIACPSQRKHVFPWVPPAFPGWFAWQHCVLPLRKARGRVQGLTGHPVSPQSLRRSHILSFWEAFSNR